MHDNMQEKMIKAEVWFTINYEMACTPTDFFMRRTGRLFFDKPSVDTYKELVVQLFKKHFNLDTISNQNNIIDITLLTLF